MPSYLVETYVPKARHATRGRRARTAASEVSRRGEPVRCVRTTFVPGDETCFHVFLANSEDAVAEVCRGAGLGSARIVSAVE